MTASERAIESALLKQRWLLTEAGYEHKQIKFSNNRIYVSGKIFGHVTNGEFHRSENYQIHPSQPLQHKDTSAQRINSNHLMLLSQQMFIHSLPDNLLKLNQSTSIFDSKIYNFSSLKILSLSCQSIRSAARRARFCALVYEHLLDIIIGCE